jgi:hypothetical protein
MGRINEIENIKCYNIENCETSYMLRCAVEFRKLQLSGSWDDYRNKPCKYHVIKEKALLPFK